MAELRPQRPDHVTYLSLLNAQRRYVITIQVACDPDLYETKEEALDKITDLIHQDYATRFVLPYETAKNRVIFEAMDRLTKEQLEAKLEAITPLPDVVPYRFEAGWCYDKDELKWHAGKPEKHGAWWVVFNNNPELIMLVQCYEAEYYDDLGNLLTRWQYRELASFAKMQEIDEPEITHHIKAKTPYCSHAVLGLPTPPLPPPPMTEQEFWAAETKAAEETEAERVVKNPETGGFD